MSVWLVEPLDPLIARDGRPAAVGRFDTVSFPYPSMLAGAVRTRMGSENGAFTLAGAAALKELKEKVIVRGPLLAELEPEGNGVLQWLAPAPQDALLLSHDDKPALKRLFPRPLRPDQATDSLAELGLQPVGFEKAEGYGKPPKDVPAFWSWPVFETWLESPQDQSAVKLSSLGIEALPVERRAHLAIQPGERVSIDGMFFQTAGLRFLHKGASPLAPRRFALSLSCEEATVAGRDLKMKRQIAPLGGERRLARWLPATKEWPVMPEAIREKIVATGRARLILLTPAVFEKGALPGWNGGDWPLEAVVKATVRAACVPRPQVVSGWNLETGRPKKTRRLAPAGSVYFIELSGAKDDVRQWCDEAWFASASDDAQDRCDGFGMAVLGTWEEAE